MAGPPHCDHGLLRRSHRGDCNLRQCTTIGSVEANNKPIELGDNVDIGAHCCIIGSGIRIGNNVRIGAMSFINKDVPDDVTYITRKDNHIYPNRTEYQAPAD